MELDILQRMEKYLFVDSHVGIYGTTISNSAISTLSGIWALD